MRAPRKRKFASSRTRTVAWCIAAAVSCALGVATLSGAGTARAAETGAAGASGTVEVWPTDANAQALLNRTLRNLYEGDFVQVFRLESQRARGRSMTRRLQVVRKESEQPGRAVLRFLSPEDIRGSAMLVIERDGQPDDVFLYLPATLRTRRISLAQRYDSFFGTNLTYEDLEPKYGVDFEARITGRGEVAGVPCLELQIRPRPDVESQYDETRSCVDPERDVALRTDYYVSGRLIKRLVVEPSTLSHLDGRWVAGRARLESTATDFTTHITSELYERKTSIPDRLFSTWNLESGSDASDLRVLRSGDEGGD
ncbi:MAG: outer membrane lipoprotein-sorting protein [Deltaproteobacteria bacterium]|nr:outer membrane lipoprotein-sorting protein [Deltaproteobacteria bacterium]MBW2448106.1 outer membrane lipoprotein-sorting protein [Deltaproteobacteria bacterium]